MAQPSPSIEDIFEEIVLPEPLQSGSRPPRPADDRVAAALALFFGERFPACREALEALPRAQFDDPRVRALWHATQGLLRGRLRPGIRACLELLEETGQGPDLYCVLGVLLLKARQRAQAHAAFTTGLLLAPDHTALRARVEAMGVRKPPPLAFLPRTHPANRLLGLVLTRFQASRDPGQLAHA